MAVTFSQLPGVLNVEAVIGDEVLLPIDVSPISLVGYTFTAPIYVVTTVATGAGGSSSSEVIGETVANWTLTEVDLSLGQLALGLPESVTGSLLTTTTYRWYLRWVAPGVVTRTALAGTLKMRNP